MLWEYFLPFSDELSKRVGRNLEELGGKGILTVKGNPGLRPVDRSPLLGIVASLHTGDIDSVWQWENSVGNAQELASRAMDRLLSEVPALRKASFLTRTLKADVVLEPWLASLFVHEVVGHTAEADNFLSDPFTPKPGDLASPCPVTVIDDPGMSGTRTRFTEDDEGNPAESLRIIEAGLWRGILTNKALMGSLPAGFETGMRARKAPDGTRALPRQSNTYLLPQPSTRLQLIESIRDGFLILGGNGGGSADTQFFLRPVVAQRIRDGRLSDDFTGKFVLGGSKRQALLDISAVGDDFEMFSPFFGCEKDGENHLPVCHGAPSVLLRQVKLFPDANLILT